MQDKGISKNVKLVILSSWRGSTQKQYDLAWRKFIFWCNQRNKSIYETSEKDLMSYLFLLFKDGKSYSCINTHKVSVTTTLSLLDQKWNKNSPLLSKFMKGLFNLRPNLPRYKFNMKHLTWKLCTLLALSTAARAQTLVNLNIKNMSLSSDRVVFYFSSLLKTSRPGKSFSISLERFKDKEICVVRSLQEYIKRTSKNRK